MSNYIVAIDLGSSKITGMVAQRNEEGLLNILAVESEPSMGVRRGLVINHSEAAGCVSRIIKKLQNVAKIEIGKVYVGLGGHTLKTVGNVVPQVFDGEQELTEEHVKALYNQNLKLNFENASVYEIMEQDILLDGEREFNPIGCFCSHVEGHYLLVLGKQGINERLCSCLERIPQGLAGMFTAPFATSEAIVLPDDKELGCAVIDFGAETTSVVVYADHYIRHMAVIPLGGKTVTQDIRDLKVTALDAEKLKKNFSFAMVDLDKSPKAITIKSTAGENVVHTKELNAIIEARMDEILDLVCDEIYKSGYMEKLGAGVIITGGASQQKGLSELITLKTGMPVREGSFAHQLVASTDEELLTPANALLIGLLNFGYENCVMEKKKEEIQTVEPPKLPQRDKSNKKSRFKDFGEKVSGFLFNERDFE